MDMYVLLLQCTANKPGTPLPGDNPVYDTSDPNNIIPLTAPSLANVEYANISRNTIGSAADREFDNPIYGTPNGNYVYTCTSLTVYCVCFNTIMPYDYSACL